MTNHVNATAAQKGCSSLPKDMYSQLSRLKVSAAAMQDCSCCRPAETMQPNCVHVWKFFLPTNTAAVCKLCKMTVRRGSKGNNESHDTLATVSPHHSEFTDVEKQKSLNRYHDICMGTAVSYLWLLFNELILQCPWTPLVIVDLPVISKAVSGGCRSSYCKPCARFSKFLKFTLVQKIVGLKQIFGKTRTVSSCQKFLKKLRNPACCLLRNTYNTKLGKWLFCFSGYFCRVI